MATTPVATPQRLIQTPVPPSDLSGAKIQRTAFGSLGLLPMLGSYGAMTLFTDRGTFIIWSSANEVTVSRVTEL